ncbi:MAG: hypothetical protein J5I52_07740 [Saprospiraceae bacterium]|nr:MAG: hypothetical protein UZ09_BCD002001634 [Bacteroidetes bacterium OLB9]MCO6464025.1 hypothetical protein [Saprospiraceae bacterium]MCZ2337217.1 hypothetical protein [Chitinophagales bacterium]
MMNIKNGLFLILIVLFALSCNRDDDQPGDVNIRFHLVYGDQPLEMFKNLAYPANGEEFYFSRISFYLSDVTLKNGATSNTIKDIDYLNLTSAFTDSSVGYDYKISNVPPGKYSKLEFGIGVPAALNAKQPSDFDPGNILSFNTEYWSSWQSYIFFKAEGTIQLNTPDGNNTDFALHLGADEALRTISLDKAVDVKSGQTAVVDVTIDMKKFFDGKQLYDIYDTQKIHSLHQLPLIKILMDNLAVSFK